MAEKETIKNDDEILEENNVTPDNSEQEKSDEKSKKSKLKKKNNEELEKAKKEIEELNDRLLRNMAEFDNFRRRTQKEKESTFNDAKIKTLTPLIGILDNLERATEAETEDKSYKQGLELVLKQFCEVLGNLGVKEIEALGKKLDPVYHMAVMHIEDKEKGENEIVSVMQKGYTVGDKVLRCSMVSVAN